MKLGLKGWVRPEKNILGAIWLSMNIVENISTFHVSLTSGLVMGSCEWLPMGHHLGELLALAMALAHLGSTNVKELCLTADESDICCWEKFKSDHT